MTATDSDNDSVLLLYHQHTLTYTESFPILHGGL